MDKSICFRISSRSSGETKTLASSVKNDVKPLHKRHAADKVQPGDGFPEGLHN